MMVEKKTVSTTDLDALKWTPCGRGSVMAKQGTKVFVCVDFAVEPWRSGKGTGQNYVYATGGRSTIIQRDGEEHEVRLLLNALEAVPEDLL